ncbi:tRNA(Ile)-lysidine synthase [Sedimentibacter acidaminivorans]|jgi:tRNA(Ile)-lysidine synthase|uniref:tRNA(Ile)-lysidine synthase n=1 Tax=Sedimentibacter acidaminivorans TaxID=913099 RepID=A0ABS4G960_9FIRM|nr:tRNA lysidine(34) synthetase TilS [Sedimentibacter acidaminivorans]MBP1924215.1 tRNA(Ile)-lysidine synthase [Sedimentibacter acidaminivorans]
MYNLVKYNILQNNLINQGDNVLIGFSGGPDSVFLFHNLRLLKETLSFNLYASHINHMYRGEDADHDEDFVRALCIQYGVKLFVKRKNATEYANELHVTEEEAGRILRYNFFRDNLKSIGGGKIAVAHNLNDQAETVLQRIIRGTGIDGLGAMSLVKDDIIRPILNVKRSVIEKYLKENRYEFCTDKTNTQAIYGRNKIRLNLIPYLEKEFNPNIQNTLFRMSEIMDKDSKIIEKYINIKYQDILLKENENEIFFDLYKLKNMEDYEVGRIVRKAIELLKGHANNIEMKHIEYANEFIRNGKTGKKIDLSEGLIVEISYNNLVIRKNIEKVEHFEYNIKVDLPLHIREIGKTIVCEILESSDYVFNNKKSFSIDYDKIIGNLVARNRISGDNIIPCGMTGRKKLKDIFIDMKVPAEKRDKTLIIADESNIIWVEGYRIHNNYKVSSSTRKILKVTIMEEKDEQ